MLEMDGSVLAPLCFSHPQWQELQGMRAIMPMPRGSSRDLRDLSTWINVGRFFCLSEGEPASFQKSCSPINTGRATGHCCELGQALCSLWGQSPGMLPSNTHRSQPQESKGLRMICLPFQESHVSVQWHFVRSRCSSRRLGFNLFVINGIP